MAMAPGFVQAALDEPSWIPDVAYAVACRAALELIRRHLGNTLR